MTGRWKVWLSHVVVLRGGATWQQEEALQVGIILVGQQALAMRNAALGLE